MEELIAVFGRVWHDMAGGVHAPLGFRVVVQPIVAAFFAVRAGRQDALEGRPLFFWAVLRDPIHRRERLQEAWKHVGKVFVAAVIIDVVYQCIVERWIYPSEALMVGLTLAVLPYLVFRGIVNRVLRDKAPGGLNGNP
jgi:hypothetical protein